MKKDTRNTFCTVPSVHPPPDVTRMQGYASRLSASPDDNIAFRMTTVARNYDVSFRRVGKTAAEIGELKGMHGRMQACPDRAWENGCDWESDFFWIVPEETPLLDLYGGIHGRERRDVSRSVCRQTLFSPEG